MLYWQLWMSHLLYMLLINSRVGVNSEACVNLNYMQPEPLGNVRSEIYNQTSGWCPTYCFRLTPVYMLLMMISICLSRYFGDGPLWPDQGMEVNYCKDTWWKNLLYINNLFNEQSVNSFSILSAKIWMSEVKKQ